MPVQALRWKMTNECCDNFCIRGDGLYDYILRNNQNV